MAVILPSHCKALVEIVEPELRSILGVLIFNTQQRTIPEEYRLYSEDILSAEEFQAAKVKALEYIELIKALGYDEISDYHSKSLEKYTKLF